MANTTADITIKGKDGLEGTSPIKAKDGVNTKENGMGQNGSDTSEDKPKKNFWGKWKKGNCQQPTKATAGEKGDDGKDATAGGYGGKPPMFILKVGTVSQGGPIIYINSNGGNAGNGGNGADGGNGATGGDAGINNAECLENNFTHLALGAAGGAGGKGGNAAKGGDGGNGGDIYVYSNDNRIDVQIAASSNTGTPGNGGNGGHGGQGGYGGKNETEEGQPDSYASQGRFTGGGNGASGGGPGQHGANVQRPLTNP